MDFQDMRIELHKDKKIGKVLFIDEGSRTEPYIMTKLFTSMSLLIIALMDLGLIELLP